MIRQLTNVITRNPRNWPVYSATAMLQLKLRDIVIIMEIELIEVILKWAIMLLLYGESVTGYSHIINILRFMFHINTILKLSSDSGRIPPWQEWIRMRSLSMSWKSQVTTHQDEQ